MHFITLFVKSSIHYNSPSPYPTTPPMLNYGCTWIGDYVNKSENGFGNKCAKKMHQNLKLYKMKVTEHKSPLPLLRLWAERIANYDCKTLAYLNTIKKVKAKVAIDQTTKAQRRSTGMAPLFL